MPSIPIVFLQTDAPAFLPPPAHQLSRVRRYRTENFIFSLAADERVLVRERANLEPILARRVGLFARARRRAGANDPETFVVTHHRVLRFTPTGWHRVWDEPPLTESPYDVVDIPLEAVAQARAVEIPGLEGSGALEIVSFSGERELFLHVANAGAMAARINELAMAYGERRAVRRQVAWSG